LETNADRLSDLSTMPMRCTIGVDLLFGEQPDRVDEGASHYNVIARAHKEARLGW